MPGRGVTRERKVRRGKGDRKVGRKFPETVHFLQELVWFPSQRYAKGRIIVPLNFFPEINLQEFSRDSSPVMAEVREVCEGEGQGRAA